jgi:ABC-2 type transport system ATP-binding protein
MTKRQVAVEVRDLYKSFRVPEHDPQGLRERLIHPVRRARPRELRLFEGISFDVRRGEWFGIVGRNGSGKSTLLRLLADIYPPDRGTITVAGRLGPFLELGAGFDQELAAHQNILLNGVILGMSPRELRRRVDEILAFAEVEEFADMPIKHFSSGMRVRLAFSVMIQADPDVLLIDEVLAVGDAGFREKCMEALDGLRERGKTILLVTHSMPSVEQHCDRAMLLHEGRIERIGDPAEVAQRYLELNLPVRLREALAGGGQPADSVNGKEPLARITDLEIASAAESRRIIGEGEPIDLHATIRVDQRVVSPGLQVELRTQQGRRIFAAPHTEDTGGDFVPGDRIRASATIENPLAPGRYIVNCRLFGDGPKRRVAASPARALSFEVAGPGDDNAGLVSLDYTVSFEPERSPEFTRG